MSVRPEQLYLTDILEAARSIAVFCKDARFDQFEGNDMLCSAVLQKLIVIGEAATHSLNHSIYRIQKFRGRI